MINNFYFLVLDYLESTLNLMIVSMLALEGRQVGDVRNREPQTLWLSVKASPDTLSRNFPVYWIEIFQNVTQNVFSVLSTNLKSCVHLPESQNTIWSTPTLLWAADFFWPSADEHSPVVSFFTWLYTATTVHRDIYLVV